MLRGWPIALVAATGASALFAFGIVQSAFAPQAQALFFVFAAVLAMLTVFNVVFSNSHAAHAHGHGSDHAVVLSGRLIGLLTVAAAVLAVAYFWTDNQLSAEKIGRHIDRGAAGLGQQAQSTFQRLSGQRDDTPPDAPAEG
jgi:hypothetical protein